MQLSDFLHRLMFWIDTGNISKVERSTLYGTQRVTIAVHNVTYSTGITLDRRRKLIFWLSQWNLIESMDYSGNNRRTVFQNDGVNFFGLTFISSDLFATNRWLSRGVYRLNPSDGIVKSKVTVTSYWGRSFGLVAYDSSLQFQVCHQIIQTCIGYSGTWKFNPVIEDFTLAV